METRTAFETRRDGLAARLRKASDLDFPHPFRPAADGRPAAVMVLCGLRERTEDTHLEVLVTRRSEHLETHKGQYALPGGMRDADTETIAETALRETEEEVGIARARIETLGNLPPIWTPSGFQVTPV